MSISAQRGLPHRQARGGGGPKPGSCVEDPLSLSPCTIPGWPGAGRARASPNDREKIQTGGSMEPGLEYLRRRNLNLGLEWRG